MEFIAPYLAPFAFAPSSPGQLHPGGMDPNVYLQSYPLKFREGAILWLESGSTFGDLPEDNAAVLRGSDLYHGL